jgi:hypothetical protein
MKDDTGDVERFTLYDLNETDYVNVRAYDDGFGGIIATEVKVKEPDGALVQGIMQSNPAPGRIKVSGVEFVVDDPGQTRFEGVNDTPVSQAEFYQLITLDKSVIKIEDDEPDGIANEIEIESL